jgi:hypothetical protein
MFDSGDGQDRLLRADLEACRLYTGAVYTLATAPGDLRDRIHDAYVGQAIHANQLVRLLPPHVSERIQLLAGRLGTHPDTGHPDATDLVWQTLLTMDHDELQDVARGIYFITHDLVVATEQTRGGRPEA